MLSINIGKLTSVAQQPPERLFLTRRAASPVGHSGHWGREMSSPLKFEDVDPSVVQDATTPQLDLTEAADDLKAKGRCRRHPQTERSWRAGDPFGGAVSFRGVIVAAG